MRIGFTYDLKDDYLAAGWSAEEAAEFDPPETIEAIAVALAADGHEVDRIGGLHRLVERLAGGDRWDLVFNIAEGARGFAREAAVPALLEAWDIPYTFSDGLTLAVSLHKGMAKCVVAAAGVPTPPFAVVESGEEARGVGLPPPLFVKPVAEGTGKGVSAASLVRDPAALPEVVERLVRRFRQPALVETYLPGTELTVGVLGTGAGARAIGAMRVELEKGAEDGAYSYANKRDYERVVRYRLVEGDLAEQAAEVAVAAWRALGCRDAGRVDLRCDAEGRPQFLEVNPLAGLNPVHSDLPILCRLKGMGYRELIRAIVAEAVARAGLDRAAAAAGGAP